MSTQQPAIDPSSTVSTRYKVTGMSCGHCEGAIRSELSEVDGVREVQASSKDGLVTVVSAHELEDEVVRAAIDEAGYELIGRA